MSAIEDQLAKAAASMGMTARRVRAIHRSMVDEMATGHLECKQCRHREELDAAQVETYLQHGWPLCCGQTMAFEEPRRAGGAA